MVNWISVGSPAHPTLSFLAVWHQITALLGLMSGIEKVLCEEFHFTLRVDEEDRYSRISSNCDRFREHFPPTPALRARCAPSLYDSILGERTPR